MDAANKPEQKLREDSDLLALLDDFPAMVWRAGTDGDCDYLNNSWLGFTGRRIEDELGKGWLDSIYPGDFDLCFEAIHKACSEKVCFRVEYRLLNVNMEFRWILHMGHPFFGSDGCFAGLIGVCYDITDSKQSQEMLRVSEDYFRSFIESSQDCIAHISSDGIFLSMNEAGLRLNGFDGPEDIANLSLTEMVISDRRLMEDAIRKAGTGEMISIQYMSKNRHGEKLWWDAMLTPVMDFDGTVRSILLVTRDITKRKLAEEALEQKNIELEKAYAELKAAQSQILQQEKMASVGQLAAGIAHEINNPMGFIISNINTLRKYVAKMWDFVDAQKTVIEEQSVSSGNDAGLRAVEEKRSSIKIDYIREDLESLITESLDGADRVIKIVQDLKSFSRLDEAEYKLADINAGIESTINIVWNELKYKVNLIRDYGEIPQTICNPGQLNQVFLNVLLNGAHAIDDHGDIYVRTRLENGRINIIISDTGKGMSPEVQKRIFEPFYTTKDVGKGTGLGLSIAYDIIKKHDGDIEVESTIGKGSSFTIRIPVVEA
jgi:two-component system NtrC family sensor kinase